MLRAKFQGHRTSGSRVEAYLKVFAIYGHGGHLGHVFWTIYTNFFPLPKEARHEIWLLLAKRFQRRRCLKSLKATTNTTTTTTTTNERRSIGIL